MSLKDAMITEEMSKKLDAAETVEEALANGAEAQRDVGDGIIFPVTIAKWWAYWKIRNTLSKWVRKLLGM